MHLVHSGFSKGAQCAFLESMGLPQDADFDLCRGRGEEADYKAPVKPLNRGNDGVWDFESATDYYVGSCAHDAKF